MTTERHICLLGRRLCGLCMTRRDVKPLPATLWRTLLGPVAKYESSPDEKTWVEVWRHPE
jgi:hypothetical protein